jgi:hypothetical protein
VEAIRAGLALFDRCSSYDQDGIRLAVP